MHVYYKFGLFWIFIISISKCCVHAGPLATNQSSTAIPYTPDSDDYYDDEDYDDYNETTLSSAPSSATMPTAEAAPPPLTTTMPPATETVAPIRSNHVLEPSCPSFCLCLNDYKYVQCSNAQLTHVPSDLPRTALMIDLSHNYIGELRDSDFANYTKVREINLSENHLSAVNKQTFLDLTHLQTLNLAGNRLTSIEPDTFRGANDLRKLNLSNNSIVLNMDGSFLQQPSLTELSCHNCSWTQLYDGTFTNLRNLTKLTLNENNFNKKINTKAFTPLSKTLIKLQLPELEQASIEELCKILTSIDNISFKHFNVSCYSLVLGTPYNESVIYATAAAPFFKPLADGAEANATKDRANTLQLNPMAEANANNTTVQLTQVSLLPPSDGDITTHNVLNAGFVVTVPPTARAAGNGEEESYQVPVSKETINIMLISIMVIAIIGIIIGLICRKDVGGIKTKCCRTRKPEAKDQVHPAEEIPLNKLA